MWDISPPAWWLWAPFITVPLALWKVIDILWWVGAHISVH